MNQKSDERPPPRIIGRILIPLLPQGPAGRSILGDLHEEYLERATRSRIAAGIWYILTALHIGFRYWPNLFRRHRKTGTRQPSRDLMHNLIQDLHFALRRLRKQPAFTLTAVAIIGLGIGANTAIFSIVNAVLFRPLPYASPETLVRIFTNASKSDDPSAVSYPDFLDYRNLTTHLEGAAATETTIYSLATEQGTEAVMAEVMSANFFAVTGLETTIGRSYRMEEDEPGVAQPVAIVSYNAWERRFGKDPNVVGRDVRLNDKVVTIIGVGPGHFNGTFVGLSTDFWVPVGTAAALDPDFEEALKMRGRRGLFVYARLQDHATAEQAQAGLNVLATALGSQYPDTNADRTVSVLPANQVRLHPMIDAFLYPVAGLLMGVVGVVLLVACTNLANLLLVRATSNGKEVAVRLALGSPRWRIISQLLTESSLLGVLGGATGLVIASLAARAIISFQPPLPIPIAIDLSLDRSVLWFTGGLSVLTGMLFGLAPAMRGSRPDLVPALKENNGSINVGGKRFGIRNLLVVTQVVLSAILLIGAGLFVRSLQKAQAVDPGFQTTGVALATFDVARGGHTGEEVGVAFFQRYVEGIASLPGVTSVALAERLPLGLGVSTRTVKTPLMEIPPDANPPEIDFLIVDDRFFATMNVPVVRGREFTQSDTPNAPSVAMVSEALALRFWNTLDVVGEEIVFGNREDSPKTEVIGVVADIKVRTLGEIARPLVYVPFSQNYTSMMTVLAETTGEPSSLVSSMRNELRVLDPDVPMFEAKTIDEHFAVTLFAPRMGAALIATFGTLAMVLAAIGLYGVIAVSVAQRTREVGVRVALGASRIDVIQLIMRQGITLAFVGLMTGLAASAILMRTLSGFLIDVGALDPFTYGSVACILLAVAAVASYIPARRAARVDPQSALRYE